MVFTSHSFVFYFLPLVLAGYALVPPRQRSLFLTLASYAFYGWWKPWFVLLMLGSTVVDHRCGAVIASRPVGDPWRLRAVWISVTANLGLLGFFKYWLFFADNTNAALGALGMEALLPAWNVVLPVGISFYTFQSMSYTIDLYRGQAQPARSFLDFAAYVSLFPQLVAGPIIRYRDLADQLVSRRHGVDKVAEGLAYFSFGLAKKVLLANNCGVLADAVFASEAPPWHLAWVGVLAYALQIYFDFSGYSDMAIGLGRFFGFRFPQNFDGPYRSKSITEFWRRWHISLSTWLRDYLYIPLGGNRKGPRRTALNLAITMLLGGLWHGAEWRFVAWGAFHGGLLAVERWRGKRGLFASAPAGVQVASTFGLVLLTWVPFRAASLGDAVAYWGSMFGLRASTLASSLVAGEVYDTFGLVVLGAAALVAWGGRTTRWWVEERQIHRAPRLALVVPALFVVSLLEMSVQSHNPFLYFQF